MDWAPVGATEWAGQPWHWEALAAPATAPKELGGQGRQVSRLAAAVALL